MLGYHPVDLSLKGSEPNGICGTIPHWPSLSLFDLLQFLFAHKSKKLITKVNDL